MAKSINWLEIAGNIVKNIGGKENIVEIFNCATRLRFELKDDSKVNEKFLKDTPQIKGVNRDGKQWQLIIGAGIVNKVMDGVNKTMKGESSTSSKSVGPKKLEPLWDRRLRWHANLLGITRRGVRGFASIFIPLIPLFIAGGLSLAINNLIGSVAVTGLDDAGNPLPGYDEVAAGFKSFFDHLGFAIFGSLPALVGYTAAKRWGGTPLLGLAVGLAISWGALTSSWAFYYQETPAQWNVGEFTLEAIGYQAQVVPALLSIVLMVFVEKLMRKICHESIAIIVVPLVTVVITVFCALWFIGPFGRLVGQGIAELFRIINQNVNFTGFGLGGMLFGFSYPFIVITGLHQSFVPIELTLVADSGYTFITPYASISNVSQGAAAILAALFIRNKNLRSTGWSGGVSAQFGITEPAMFGVNLPLKYPIIAGAIGSALGGYWAGMANLQANTFGSASWVGLVQFDFTADNIQQYFADNKVDTLDPILPTLAPVGHAAIAMTIGVVGTIGAQLLLRRTKWARKQLKEVKLDLDKFSFKKLPNHLENKWNDTKKSWKERPVKVRINEYFVETGKNLSARIITPKSEIINESKPKKSKPRIRGKTSK